MTTKPRTTDQSDEPIEEFEPRRGLRERVLKPGNATNAALKAINNAEEALEELSVNFDSWMQDEVEKLVLARAAMAAGDSQAPPLEPLFAAAHDLKGQADTLGYPFIGQVCASLCRLMEAVSRSRIPDVLLNQHVDAVRAMVREEAKGNEHPTAAALARKLADVVDHYISSQAPAPAAADEAKD